MLERSAPTGPPETMTWASTPSRSWTKSPASASAVLVAIDRGMNLSYNHHGTSSLKLLGLRTTLLLGLGWGVTITQLRFPVLIHSRFAGCIQLLSSHHGVGEYGKNIAPFKLVVLLFLWKSLKCCTIFELKCLDGWKCHELLCDLVFSNDNGTG